MIIAWFKLVWRTFYFAAIGTFLHHIDFVRYIEKRYCFEISCLKLWTYSLPINFFETETAANFTRAIMLQFILRVSKPNLLLVNF